MICRTFPALFAVLVLAAPLFAADEIKPELKRTGKGETVLIEQNAVEESQMQVFDAAGKKVQEQQEKTVKAFVFRETPLEIAEGKTRPTKLTRHYDKAEVTKKDKTEKLPYEGKTVLIEKKDDKFVFSVDGKELTGDDAKFLQTEFNKEQEDDFDIRKTFLPEKAVKVEDTWKVDTRGIVKGLSQSLLVDAEKAKGTGKLLELRDEKGKKFGKLDFKVDLPLTAFVTPKGKLPVMDGSKMTMEFAFDACVDGSTEAGTLKTNLQMAATSEVDAGNNVKLTMKMSSQVKGEEKRSEVKK